MEKFWFGKGFRLDGMAANVRFPVTEEEEEEDDEPALDGARVEKFPTVECICFPFTDEVLYASTHTQRPHSVALMVD